MVRGRWKAIFCSTECRAQDRNAIRDEKRVWRKEHSLCPACGRKSRSAREQMQQKGVLVTSSGA